MIESQYDDQKSEELNFFWLNDSWPIILWGAGLSSLFYLSYLVLPLYAIDDYYLYQTYQIDSSTLGYNFYSTGRFGQLILADFFQQLNIQPLTRPIGSILFIFSLSYLSVLLLNAIAIEHFLLKLAFSLLVILNPFMAELFHYSVIPAYSAFAIFFLTLGFAYGNRFSKYGNRLDLGFSIAMYSISLSIYQIFYPMIFVFFLFQIVTNYANSSTGSIRNTFSKRQFISLIPYFLAFVLYSLVLNIIFKFYPPSIPYNGTSFGDLIENFSKRDYWYALIHNIEIYILKDNPFNSIYLNTLILMFFLFSISIFTYNKIRFAKSWNAAAKSLSIVAILMSAILLLGLISCLGLSILRPAEISSRSLTAFGIYQASLVTCSYISLQRSGVFIRYRAVISMVIIGVLILGCAGRIGRIALDQYRLNSFDKSLATRIVTRLESFSDFSPDAKLVILGAPKMGALSRTWFGDYNVSALQHFSRVFVINELTGYSFKNPNTNEINSARTLVEDKKPWPSADSVISSNGTFIVLLSK